MLFSHNPLTLVVDPRDGLCPYPCPALPLAAVLSSHRRSRLQPHCTVGSGAFLRIRQADI